MTLPGKIKFFNNPPANLFWEIFQGPCMSDIDNDHDHVHVEQKQNSNRHNSVV